VQTNLASQTPLNNPSRTAAVDDSSKGGLLIPKPPGKVKKDISLASSVSEQMNRNKTVYDPKILSKIRQAKKPHRTQPFQTPSHHRN
jgi:hypothetical protein